MSSQVIFDMFHYICEDHLKMCPSHEQPNQYKCIESLQPYFHRMELCVCGEEATREEVLTEHWCSSQGGISVPSEPKVPGAG